MGAWNLLSMIFQICAMFEHWSVHKTQNHTQNISSRWTSNLNIKIIKLIKENIYKFGETFLRFRSQNPQGKHHGQI